MSFPEAIQDGFNKYTDFSTRSSRSAYWWWALFAVLVLFVSEIVSIAAHTIIIYAIVALALLIPNIAVGVRRLHDTNRSGWWYLIAILPLVGGIVLLIF